MNSSIQIRRGQSSSVPFVEGIWVEPGARAQKIGAQFISAIETWALENGFREIGSDCLLDNSVSEKAHLAWGFQETERVIYFRKKLAGSPS